MVQAVSRPPASTGLRLALPAFTQLIVALDYNVVYVALPDITRAPGFTAASAQWIVSAYAVGLGGLLLLGGRAVDRLGPRRMFALGLTLYALASLTGGLAPGSGVLIAARAVQGVGGVLTNYPGWEWVFYVNVPLALAAALAPPRLARSSREPRSSSCCSSSSRAPATR